MSLSQIEAEQPFYFKSYDEVIGVARNVNELQAELARLAEENPVSIQYYLKEGHIVRWLNYSNEKALAEQLKGVESVEEAGSKIARYLQNKSTPSGGEPAPFHKKSHSRKDARSTQ